MINFSIYNSAPPTRKPNLTKIPRNHFNMSSEADRQAFNEIYQYCKAKSESGELKELPKTKSGGISIKVGALRGACWELIERTSAIEIILRNFDARYYRFVIGHVKDKTEPGMFGRAAFRIYKEELLKTGVDIDSLAIENGKEVKATIPAAKIDLVEATTNRTYINAFHIDLNSAFNAGMMTAFPVLEPAIRNMYNMRKVNADYKQVLNMTQGVMQSVITNYRFSHISKAGYVWTNNKIEELTEKLRANNFKVLSYNTDGIWACSKTGEYLEYSDEEQGTDIGQWKIDHHNCKIRFKSKGAYEFIENEKYTPVFRGTSSYERIKPREDWEWGDIFNGETKTYIFDREKGVVEYDY